ncbi:Pycsar system effector family protein [Streptomyces sp. NRRL F-525]|uniref:Pycsar system effector family protein n=1 Tax=Streptomyces sp. NRRL F-525 TaxID=1463861 RepID=UPI00131CA26C|nr:Pycsar system effector family protein [Streptomyces sp. NRRL F-525]
MADNMLGRELVRHDTKASLLIAVDGGVLALVAAITHNEELGWDVRLPGTFGLAVLAASIPILLLSIRPVLDDQAGEGWELWSDLDRDNLMVHMRTDRRPERVLFLSRIVRRKFRQLRLAVDLLITGLLLLAVAAFTAAVGR